MTGTDDVGTGGRPEDPRPEPVAPPAWPTSPYGPQQPASAPQAPAPSGHAQAAAPAEAPVPPPVDPLAVFAHVAAPRGPRPGEVWTAPADPYGPPRLADPAGAPGTDRGVPGQPHGVPTHPYGAPAPGPLAPGTRRPRRARGGAWVALALVVGLVAGAAGGVAGSRLWPPRSPDADLPPAATVRPDGGALTGVAEIAAGVLPSVVLIEVRGADGEGTGSGFVLRSDGYILTNNHVANAAVGAGRTITVIFADGAHADATLVGSTSDYDLAVLKVDRSGLTPLALGDSDAVVVGDPVVAVGAPLGLQGTVTTGIVSALHRPVTAGADDSPAFIDAIQTDAAINPGNSGGPLVDASGQVVGINSAIAQPPGSSLAGTGGSIGLGFAIPANQARHTAEQLIETGRATYPIIGVLIDESYTGEGVKVVERESDGRPPLTPDGPADRAGLKPGDVILSIDGRPVTQPDELIVAIRAREPGDSVTLRVRTGEAERDVRVVLSESASD